MIDRLLGLATGRRVLVALVLLGVGGRALFLLGPYPALKRLAPPFPLPEETTTAIPELRAFLEHLGSSGREVYAAFQWWDMLNPVLVAVAGTLLVSWLINRAGHQRRIWRYAAMLPLLAAVADVAENLLLRAAIVAHPELPAMAVLLPSVTKAKLLGLMLTVPIAIGLSFAAIVRAARARMRRPPAGQHP